MMSPLTHTVHSTVVSTAFQLEIQMDVVDNIGPQLSMKITKTETIYTACCESQVAQHTFNCQDINVNLQHSSGTMLTLL